MTDLTKTVAPDSNSVVDSVVWRYAWASHDLTYGFTASDIDGDGRPDFDEGNWRAFYGSIFADLSTFTPLTFHETAASAALLNQILGSGGGGQSSDPAPGVTQTGTELDISGTAASASSAVYLGQYSNSWLHEIGHSLGLRHTFEVAGEIDDGVRGEADLGVHFLNSSLYSVMSYSGTVWGEDNPWTPSVDPGQTVLNANLGSYGPIDVAALQYIYGAKAHDTGDDVYTFGDDKAADAGYTTIWDTGGTDTIRYVGSSRSKIDLRAATLDKQVGGGGFLSTSETLTGGFLIANGVTIENAIGGSGDDIIIGNAVANTLTGGSGHDTLTGGGGADVFKDTAADHDGDTITDFTNLDTLRFTDAALGSFSFGYDASTGRLTYATGGGGLGLSLSPGLSGAFVATTDPSGGVDLRLAAATVPAATPAGGSAAPAPTGQASTTAGQTVAATVSAVAASVAAGPATAPATAGTAVADVGGAIPAAAPAVTGISDGQAASAAVAATQVAAQVATVPTASRAVSTAPVDTIALDPGLAYTGDGGFGFTGHASSTAGVASVAFSAEVDGARRQLGFAAVAADGSFAFTDAVDDPQSFIVATMTDGAGGRSDVASPASLARPPEGSGFVAEIDSYDGGAQTSVALIRANGHRQVDVLTGGQTLASSGFDVFLNHGAPDNTFVFDPGFGRDVVRQFRIGGDGGDTLALSGADFDNSVAEVLRDSRMVSGAVVISDPVTGDILRLAGVTKRELIAGRDAVTFHA